ncbi:hypothetical protein EXU57_11220 [Segetibacter sp. 3557_3]|uniref:hypothetical protein n=1 Tax=Segetibacter sp. 3557_3 TaxID=2547429 RepID=UPI0010586E1C|nr:hypothetical protein [Segetibacter sp. 3557_3]TDH26063.1 hypothetical protein EXU57_11220 [Segetibacter sp. 3557_3]
MLKGKELRIGNWIAMLSETSITEDIYTTKQIATGSEIDQITKLLQISNGNGLIAYKAILITPEILLQFGFKKGTKSDYYKEFINSVGDVKKLYIGIDEGSYFWGIEEELKSVPIEKIRFLHQLQNIYYSLSNHELVPQQKTTV